MQEVRWSPEPGTPEVLPLVHGCQGILKAGGAEVVDRLQQGQVPLGEVIPFYDD